MGNVGLMNQTLDAHEDFLGSQSLGISLKHVETTSLMGIFMDAHILGFFGDTP